MKHKVNYLFFIFFFFTIAALHLHHLSIITIGTSFYVYAVDVIVQCFLETFFIGFLSILIARRFSKKFYYAFLIASFFLLSLHVLEFPFLRLMDVSIWKGIAALSDETWINIVELLRASNIELQTWFLGAVAFAVLFLLGIGFCILTEKLSAKKPLALSIKFCLLTMLIGPLFLLLWDGISVRGQNPLMAEKIVKALPWKGTLYPPEQFTYQLASPLKPFYQENEVLAEMRKINKLSQKKPDIFLFVIESLREDFLTEENAPNFYNFKTEHNNSHLSFSNANGTQISWFSLFYSKYPFYWRESQARGWQTGALPLRILKEKGYDIHVYSSSRLSFFQMKNSLFGTNCSLLTSYQEFPPELDFKPWQSDEKTLAKLTETYGSSPEKGGRVFIIFLESTHFDYSWPTDTTNRFTPVIDSFDYLQAALFKKDTEPLKNRYRNAIHYVDRIVGKFIDTVKTQDDEALIVITGDHGEEFFEESHLFHASNLNDEQTRVPIYYNIKGLNNRPTSHMDIFPTLLHHIDGEKHFENFFEGRSLLGDCEPAFVIAGRYNLGRTPYEFFIYDGKNKLRARFSDRTSVFNCTELEIISLEKDEGSYHETFDQIFSSALNSLFAPSSTCR